MIKYLLILMFLVSCGGDKSDTNSNGVVDAIATEQSLPFQGVLEVMDADNLCFGGSFYYIQYNSIRYQVSDYSIQKFLDTLENIHNGVVKYKPFEAGGCHNKYNIQFQGKFTKEMKWVGAGEVMTDVIQIEAFIIK